MNRYHEIAEKFVLIQNQIKDLDKEYEDKIRGEAYNKRKFQLVNNMDDLKKQALAIGTTGIICHVSGKKRRPHIKNPQLMVTERFNLYFVNINEEEASALVKLHIKNVEDYTIRFIRPGKILTTS